LDLASSVSYCIFSSLGELYNMRLRRPSWLGGFAKDYDESSIGTVLIVADKGAELEKVKAVLGPIEIGKGQKLTLEKGEKIYGPNFGTTMSYKIQVIHDIDRTGSYLRLYAPDKKNPNNDIVAVVSALTFEMDHTRTSAAGLQEGDWYNGLHVADLVRRTFAVCHVPIILNTTDLSETLQIDVRKDLYELLKLTEKKQIFALDANTLKAIENPTHGPTGDLRPQHDGKFLDAVYQGKSPGGEADNDYSWLRNLVDNQVSKYQHKNSTR